LLALLLKIEIFYIYRGKFIASFFPYFTSLGFHFTEFYFAYCILENNTELNRLNRNDNSSGKKKNKFISVRDTYRIVLNFFESSAIYVEWHINFLFWDQQYTWEHHLYGNLHYKLQQFPRHFRNRMHVTLFLCFVTMMKLFEKINIIHALPRHV